MPPTPQSRSMHPPLAHDGRGLPIALPDGATGWRLKRQTAGRPKIVLGPDRHPLRIPLEATSGDLVDLCGAGTFRLDAIDDAGQVIDFVTTVTVGPDGSANDAADADPMPMAPRGGGSELRYALEVTAHMARAQSDALRSIATAQADWIKGLAAAKVLPRNGLWQLPPPPVATANDHADDDDDDDDDHDQDDDPTPVDPNVAVLGHLASIARDMGPVVRSIFSGGREPISEPRNAAPTAPALSTDLTSPAIRIAVVLDQVSPRARAIACRVLAKNDDTARSVATALQTLPIDEAATQLERMAQEVTNLRAARHRGEAAPTAPPADPTAHLAAVMGQLSPEEIAHAQLLIGTLDPARLEALKGELLTMSASDAAALIRRALAERSQTKQGDDHVSA